MNCNFAVKVSMMLDGELSAAEQREIKTHIVNCAECQSLEKDFLFFSRQLKEINFSETQPMLEISKLSLQKRDSIWKRRIFIPAFAFSLIVLIFAGLGVWFLIVRLGKNEQATTKRNQVLPPKSPAADKSSLEIFDKGGRAEIYIVQRQAK